MRSFRASRLALSLFGARRLLHHGGNKSRADVLARWNAAAPSSGAAAAAAAADAAAEPSTSSSASSGKGMSFASGIFSAPTASTRVSSENSTIADVTWDLCERMDYFVQYAVPATWSVAEAVRENSVSIQCSPPPEPVPVGGRGRASATGSRPSVHGISINCFAYKQRVSHPDSGKLLHIFLKRFNASVSNSLQILSEHVEERLEDVRAQPPAIGGDMGDETISEMLANRLKSAVAEVTFTTGPGQPLAHGLCRAFFNSNARFHYVVVVAVPEGEFSESQDLMINTLVSVVESRVEAAAKQT